MDFEQEEQKGVIIKYVNLTRATKEHAEKFKKFLLKDIREENCKVIVDLSMCEFIDSTFISTLVIALKSINSMGGTLKLIAVHSDVQSIFELTGMVKVFDIYKNVKDALTSFKS
ncbi:MAG: hypothetical protein A2057_08325 [Ignavibacteria bacterium GWA2_35_9]|nr:MAG: hypothetical protein A2057_08325 [Ignavibacteria bacterium GWA2_35_9]OGU46099.1 MAG: hypothetical protein A2000_11750 [Ignavibacteria bacterium GWB2_36_8]OGU53121.1 MAG: hypothetical protein A2080_00370 [Ignavibacteria bacterium GWC2_36_12]OGU95982.1 MAG: hypothetical protein A2330_11160 [Ignavibacteria bacterium RIFOXYB2_FULL_36_7]